MTKVFNITEIGFTIAELMIVIVVIGVLVALVITTFIGIQDRSKAAVIADTMVQASHALKENAIADGITVYWDDDKWTSLPGKPPLKVVIAETGLRNYLQIIPEIPGIPSDSWTYDNDLDTYNGCSTMSTGVNIYIPNLNNVKVAQAVDNSLDDGDLACGKVRYDNGGRLIYSVSYSPNID